MTTRIGRFQCLGLAAVLALGAGLAWAFLGLITAGMLDTLLRPVVGTYRISESLTILRDGTPIIQSYSGVNFAMTNFRTLDGKPHNKPFHVAESGASLSGPFSERERLTRLMCFQRIVSFGQASNGAVWYFVHDGLLHGHGYFVGYDSRTRFKVGYIGRTGFRANEPEADDQFSIDGRWLRRGD